MNMIVIQTLMHEIKIKMQQNCDVVCDTVVSIY